MIRRGRGSGSDHNATGNLTMKNNMQESAPSSPQSHKSKNNNDSINYKQQEKKQLEVHLDLGGTGISSSHSSSRRRRRSSDEEDISSRERRQQQQQEASQQKNSYDNHYHYNVAVAVNATTAATEDYFADQTTNRNDNTDWHTLIQKRDWRALQRSLDLVVTTKPSSSSTQSTPSTHSDVILNGNSNCDYNENNSHSSHYKQRISENNHYQSQTGTRNDAAAAAASLGTNTHSKKNNNTTKSKLKRFFRRTVGAAATAGTSSATGHVVFMGKESSSDNNNNNNGDLLFHNQQQQNHHQSSADGAYTLDRESLLNKNNAGRTPLQVALACQETPDHMLRDLLRAQPKAVSMTDSKGRLPLHFAVVLKRRIETIKTIVELYPRALYHRDQKGKTPIMYAMEVAKRQTDLEVAPSTFWSASSTTTNNIDGEGNKHDNTEGENTEIKWQQQQMKQWATVLWLLQKSTTVGEPMLSSSHSQATQEHPKEIIWHGADEAFNKNDSNSKKKAIINISANDTQQSFLLEAMLHAAPPDLVSHLISVSSDLHSLSSEKNQQSSLSKVEQQQQAISIGCSAFYLAIFRQYPISVLKQLGSLLTRCCQVRTVRDETGLGLVSAHYVTSCFEKSKLLEYVAAEDFMITMEQCIVEGQLPEDDIFFLEWFDKLKYLIFFCADKDTEETPDDYLLHAALENTDTPPNVIRLLLALYPGSARQPDTQSAHPLHLFSMHRDYIPRNYESPYMHGLNVMDMLLSLDESAVFHNFQRRLPFHHAIAAGRTWNTIHSLITSYRSSLKIQDPITKLYPCQMAAAYRNKDRDVETTRLLQLTRNQYSSIVWQGLSKTQQQTAVERIRQFESLKRLDTVFELLRRYPQCVESALGYSYRKSGNNCSRRNKKKEVVAVKDEEMKKSSDSSQLDESAGPEMIAFHYLSWCYKKTDGKWNVVKENMKILQVSINVATEHAVLSRKSADFVNWWEMLKLYYWHCYKAMPPTQKAGPSIPRDDSFLLHVAVSISTTPPDIVQLILGLCPESASLALPGSSSYPLHLACKTTTYTPQYFEVSTRPSTIELLLRANPEAVFVRSDEGQVPLHIAIKAGKTMNELHSLIRQGPSLVSALDPLTDLYPYQLMAMSKNPSNDFRLRLQTIASNRHAEDWNRFSHQRKTKEIGIVDRQYQLKVFTSIFELLRLRPSVMAWSLGLEECDTEIVPAAGLVKLASDGLEDAPPGEQESRRRVPPLKRLLSGLSAERGSTADAGSTFASIDMMSTISNVSSRLSFRRNRSVRSVGNSAGKLSSPHMQNDAEDAESEDSDIWSEDISFFDDTDKKQSTRQHKDKLKKDTKPENTLKAIRKQLKSKWEGPMSFATEPVPRSLSRRSVPKEIVGDPIDVDDDVSYLDGIDPRSRSGRANGTLRRTVVVDDLSENEENSPPRDESSVDEAPAESPTNFQDPEIQDDEKESSFRSNPHIVNKIGQNNAVAVLSGNSDSSSSSPPNEAAKKDVGASNVSDAGNRSKSDVGVDSDDASIQDEIVHMEEEEQQQQQEEEEEPIVFHLRRRGGKGPLRIKPGGKSLGGSQQGSSIDMDFLSILNASLPEGRMDFLSTLEVSSGTLNQGANSLPSGLDITSSAKVNRMAKIKEFPTESEHGASVVQQFRETEIGKLDSSITRESVSEEEPTTQNSTSELHLSQHGQLSSDPMNVPESVHSTQKLAAAIALGTTKARDPAVSPHNSRSMLNSTHNSGSVLHSSRSMLSSAHNSKSSSIATTSRSNKRSTLEINHYIGVKPYILKSCLHCGKNSREVLMLPCTHLCLCIPCSEEVDEIKSCPICFGPVEGIKVALQSASLH